MANLDRNLTVLMHIDVYCKQILATLERFECSFENFNNDNDFRDSVSMKVFQIGELVNHLSSDYLTQTQNEIDWNQIRGMRNRFAHGYFDMDRKVIFNTAQKDIPKLQEFVKKEIDRLSEVENLEDEEEI